MYLSSKLASYRSEIRKEEIQKIFASARKSLTTPFPPQLSSSNPSQSHLNQVYNNTLTAMKQHSYKQFIRETMRKYPLSWLQTFLIKQADQTAHVMATKVLGEYLYYQMRSLDIQLLQTKILGLLFDLLQRYSPESQVFYNCLEVIKNIVEEYDDLTDSLIHKHNLITLFARRLQTPLSDNCILTFLKAIRSLIVKIDCYHQLELLFPPLHRLIRNHRSQSIKMICFLNISRLIKIFPNSYHQQNFDLLSQIIIPDFINWFKSTSFTARRLIGVALDLIELYRKQLTEKQKVTIVKSMLEGITYLKLQESTQFDLLYTPRTIINKVYSWLLQQWQELAGIVFDLLIQNECDPLKQLILELQQEEEQQTGKLLSKLLLPVAWHLDDLTLAESIRREIIQFQKRIQSSQMQELCQQLELGEAMEAEL